MAPPHTPLESPQRKHGAYTSMRTELSSANSGSTGYSIPQLPSSKLLRTQASLRSLPPQPKTMVKTLLLATATLLSVSTGAQTASADKSAAVLPSPPYHPPRPVSPQEQKLIFNRFIDGFLLTGNPLEALQDHLADDYIQHNPAFLSGKATVVQAFGGDVSAFMTFPANVITRGFDEEQQHGWVQYYFTPAAGAQPDVIVDIFRMNGSAIQEHWDVIQRRPENATNPLAMFTPPQH